MTNDYVTDINVGKIESEDLISREAVGYYIQSYIHEIITESGTDKNEHTNGILRAILNGIKTMPSVTPKANTGKWNFIGYCMFECSSCGTPYTQQELACMRKYSYEEFPKHCPNCGAKMESEEER